MDSALIRFLKQDYPTHFKLVWDDQKMQIHREEHTPGKFEIRDKKDKIIQYTGDGVSVINNNSTINVEVIDFEKYITLFNGTKAGESKMCDFIINPVAGHEFIVLNELTESASNYIRPFTSPETGEQKEGKRAYAQKQLAISIEKFYEVNDFLDSYKRKVALFSCRLTDGRAGNSMTKSMKAFQRPQKVISNIRGHNPMPHGFVFEQRIYNNDFKVIKK